MHPETRHALETIRRLELGEPINPECPRCGSRHTWGDGGRAEGGCKTCGVNVLPGIGVNDPPIAYGPDGNPI